MEKSKIIELKDVHKIYTVNGEEEVVLRSLNYQFDRGYKTSIIGSSGCGKTTVLNIIGGVETNYEGEVLFQGKPILDFDRFRRENISYIFQNLNLVNHLNLVENIKIGLTNEIENKTEKALSLLEKVGLLDHAYKKPLQLSGGEKQRVAIARALARDTDILLCDEPTGSLDKKMKFEIMDLIVDVFKEKTIIFVTHDLDIASKYSDVILGIENKVLVENKRIDKEIPITVTNEDYTEKSFANRSIQNLLYNKFSLVNSAYLTIVIAAIFMFGIGAIVGVEREVDQYLIDNYKTQMFSIGNPGFSYNGMIDNVQDFNDKYREDIAGFMVGLEFNITNIELESNHDYFLNSIQESVKKHFEEDLVAGRLPEESNEILYSLGAAKKIILEHKVENATTDAEFINAFDFVSGLSEEELLSELLKLNLSYKNTYRFNVDRFYDNTLIVVGLIDDTLYVSSGVFSAADVERYNTYGINVNQEVKMESSDIERSMIVNTNVYMLEEEFTSFVSTVYIGLNSHSFHNVRFFIDEEDLDKREYVFDRFLLFKPLFRGRDYITMERDEYYADMFGYKVSILGGCALIGALGLVSLFNGIKSNVDKYKSDIGIYRTLGYTSKNIRRMFFIEGTIISFVIILSVIGLWGVLNLILNESIVLALDPNRIINTTQIIHFDIFSALMIVFLVEAIVLLSINKQLKEVSIIELIRNK